MNDCQVGLYGSVVCDASAALVALQHITADVIYAICGLEA